jgi:TonB family protein
LQFGIVVWLICGAFLVAESYSSTGEKQQAPSSNANPQEPRQSAEATARGAGVEVLSDTKGVDVGPYLKSVLKIVKRNWYNLIPQSARAPKMKRGDVSIELAILREGKIKGMRLAESSGDVSLDAAACSRMARHRRFEASAVAS